MRSPRSNSSIGRSHPPTGGGQWGPDGKSGSYVCMCCSPAVIPTTSHLTCCNNNWLPTVRRLPRRTEHPSTRCARSGQVVHGLRSTVYGLRTTNFELQNFELANFELPNFELPNCELRTSH